MVFASNVNPVEGRECSSVNEGGGQDPGSQSGVATKYCRSKKAAGGVIDIGAFSTTVVASPGRNYRALIFEKLEPTS